MSQSWTFTISNIAGIREAEATVQPGLNAVRAANWRGKSSFIEAIRTAMGTAAPLTEGADRGRVTLETSEGTYAVNLRRDGNTVVREGTPYLTDEYDAVRADLYAFLGEGNEIRRAVRNGENLEDPLTRPLDFENIEERIADRSEKRERVDAELESAEGAAERLPALQGEVTRLESRLEDLRERQERLADTDGDGDAREELIDVRSERDRLEQRRDRLESSVERTGERLANLREERADLEVPDHDVESDLVEARERLDELERDIGLLQSVYSANKRVLDEDRADLVSEVDRSLVDDTMACWVCGREADAGTLEAQVERLGDRIADHRADAGALRDRVEELEAKRREVRNAERRRSDLDSRIVDLESSLSEKRALLSEVEADLGELDERIDRLSATAEEADSTLTDVKSEAKFVEAELEDKRAELDEAEMRAQRREALREMRKDLSEVIRGLRNRKEEIERRTREAFDESMSEVLARFDTSFESVRLTPGFELVVARDGREASLDALSEGETELIGFVTALAGREAFEVGETIPIMLLDGLGGLADANLRSLVDYLESRAEYLVFTAYPEHGSFDGNEIDPAGWSVVSDESRVTA